MKNALLITSLLFSAVSAVAQNGYYDNNKKTKVSIGFEAGANMTNMTQEGLINSEISTSKAQYKYKTGVRAGAVVNISFKQRIDLRTGIYYSVKGAQRVQFSNSFLEYNTYGNLNIKYLELPVNMFVHIGQSRNLFLGGGGYVAYAIAGSNNIHFTDSKNLNTSPSNFKRTDYGVQAVAGYRIVKNLFVQAQLSRGLSNLVYDANYIKPYSYKNWGFSFTAGWMLGK